MPMKKLLASLWWNVLAPILYLAVVIAGFLLAAGLVMLMFQMI